jgi:hypothetical protein
MFIYALVIDQANPSTLYAGTYSFTPPTAGSVIYKSTDGGGNWSPTDTALPTVGATMQTAGTLVINPTSPTTRYEARMVVIGEGGGVYKSTNSGESWNPYNNGLTTTSVLTLAIDPTDSTKLYAGTSGGGVFARNDDVVNCTGIGILKAYFGKPAGVDTIADVNQDGVVDIRDFSYVSRRLPAGTTCP